MLTRKALRGWMSLFGKASHSLINQAVVSLGNLFVNVQLAWFLRIEEYGVFALLISGLFALQVVIFSLLSYPMSLRLATSQGNAHARLLSNTLVLVLCASSLLSLLLISGLYVFGRSELIVPASLFFVCWQFQEATRRGLLANLRHLEATIGDSITYLGQPLLIGVFAAAGPFDLKLALFLMAAACAGGLAMHLTRLRLARPALAETRGILASFWLIGRWQISINAILFLNVRLYPWALAYAEGAAAAAGFQAMLNIVNLMNPLIIGLGNAIPQIASKARANEGLVHAWRASRALILIGLPFAIVFAIALLLVPNLVLQLFYGKGSPYLGIDLALQIVALSLTARYIGDLICCFLIGVEAGRFAVMSYCAGLAAVLLLFPFALPFGLSGIAGTMTISSVVLLIAAYRAVTLVGARHGLKADKAVSAA
jgi:O-antigen/teichoic acid export membrane protein